MHSLDKVKISQQQIEERCANPSLMARFASWINYDYNNCQGLKNSTPTPNIAMTAVDYITQLVLQPMVHMGEKVGKSLENYFNQFKGFNYYIYAPLILVILIIASILSTYLLLKVYFHGSKRNYNARGERSNQSRVTGTPRKSKIGPYPTFRSIR